MDNKIKLFVFLKDIKKSKLTRKFVIFIIALILIPIIIIDAVAVTMSYNSLVNKTKDSIFSAVKSSADYYDSSLKFTQDMSLQIVTNDMFIKYYSSNLINTEEERENAQKNVQKLVSNVQVINKFCSGVYILTDDQTSILYPNDFTYALDFTKIKNSKWYKEIIEKEGEPLWVDKHYDNFDSVLKENNMELSSYASSLGRSFNDNSTNAVKGVLLIDISEEALKESLNRNKLSKNGYVAIITPSGKIITPSDMKNRIMLGKDILSRINNKIKNKKGEGTFNYNISNNNILINYTISNQSGWKYIGVVPLSDIVSSAKWLMLIIILVTLVFTLLALIIGIYFVINITNDIKTVTNALSVAASGNLTMKIDVKRDDEIGELSNSYNKMAVNIRELILKGKEMINKANFTISSLVSISDENTKASNEIAKAIQNIAQGAGEQADDASKILENVSNFSQRINSVVKASSEMDKLSNNISNMSINGMHVVETLNIKTDENYKLTTNLINITKMLGDHTKSIGKIIQLLSSISEQTKLLALNASIEAAKAGDYGRGFAVVATEIRKLADQSKNSTKDIEDLLKKIINQTKEAEIAASNVETIINDQTKSVLNVSESFNTISKSIIDLSNKIAEIYKDIKAIDNDKDMITKGIESISSISEETAASTQEVAASTQEQLAAIEELSSIAESLQVLSKELESAMEVFKV
ncbi:methyl-accepting chemotaxis protein [Caldicellulosiruptoraceae bacterium PP1]